MSERTLKQLVGALVVVVGLWAIAALFSSGGGSIGAAGDIAGFFEGVDASTVSAVRLSGTGGPVELRREEATWTVNGFESDSSTVAGFLNVLSNLEVGDLVASNPANHDRMRISSDSAGSLEFEIDGDVRTMLIGKSGPRYATVYGRLPGADEVYLLEGDLRRQVIRRLEDWRNKRMVAIDTSAVQRLEIERDGPAFVLVRGDSAWTFEGGGDTDPVVVRGLLGELKGLLASGFLEEADSLAALAEGGSTIAYSQDGELLVEITIGSGERDRWARVLGSDVLYRLPAFRVDRVVPTREKVEPAS